MAATAFPFHTKSPNALCFLSTYISPKEVILGTDIDKQMYCHLLCGLRHFDAIDGITAPYAAGLVKAFTFLESQWENLSEYLENGIPCSEISDPAMRQSVIKILEGPRPDLSRRVRLICGEESWEGIVSKLWPNVHYVKSVTTGSMAQYYPKLKYYCGETPVLGADYFASECCVAINLDLLQPPDLTCYVLLPTAAYFEFLPFDDVVEGSCVTDEQKVVDVSGVEVGKMYELVVTTFRGLYRLHLGDIVKVVGFYYTSPQVEFVMRAPKSSGQIITEKDLMSSMASFQLMLRDEFAAEVTEFASFLDFESEPKQLKVFVEVKNASNLLQNDRFTENIDAQRKCCSFLEYGFGGTYQVMKERNEIGPLSVIIVRPGSFDWLLEEAVRNGAPAGQYKPPKIITSSKFVDYLETSAVVTLSSDSSHI